MEQSTLEANRFSASQDSARILWKLRVRYRIHKVPSTCPHPEPARSSHPHIPLPEDPS